MKPTPISFIVVCIMAMAAGQGYTGVTKGNHTGSSRAGHSNRYYRGSPRREETRQPTLRDFNSSAHFHSSASSYTPSSRSFSSHTARYADGVIRDSKGRIERSSAARREFETTTGYPHGRPGYVIDHIVPLKRGGCDCPSNMQWQTIADAKAKDRWE